MKNNTFVLLFCLLLVKSYAQKISLPYNEYQRGKITFESLQTIKVENLKIMGDSVTYNKEFQTKTRTTALSDIYDLRLAEGNHAILGAEIGGGIAALIVLREIILVEKNPLVYVYKKNAKYIYPGFIGGGIVIGGLVGLVIPKWKSHYCKGKKVSNVSILPDYDVANVALGLTIKCKL